jgi:hypothetical protein
MTIIYRILSIIINTVALLLTISLVFSIPMLVSSPITLLSAFLMVAVVLYSWFSSKFYRQVLLQQKVVSHKLRDWVRVNGFVCIVFSVITFLNVLFLIKTPGLFTQTIQNYGVEVPISKANSFLYIMLVYAIVLFVHVIWTFGLLKKNKDYFQ